MRWAFEPLQPSRPCPLPVCGTDALSRSTASIASAAISPTTPSRWASTRTREPPFFFQKNPDNIVPPGKDSPIPARPRTCISRSRLVVALGKGGTNMPVEKALDLSMAMASAST